VSANEADAEGLQHAAEVRRVLMALDLLGERPVGIVAHDVEAVAIQCQRHAVPPAGVVEDRDVAMQILMGPEAQGRGGGRIVDHPVQRCHGAAVLEPRVRADVELGELAERRLAGGAGCDAAGPPADGWPAARGPSGYDAPRSD
jgi:hypothetical protein